MARVLLVSWLHWLLSCSLATRVALSARIRVSGAAFIDTTTGSRFIVKGIAYQPSGATDPISNSKRDLWQRDLELIASLGVNVIRVYQVDSSQTHDEFMAALAERKMFLLLDLGRPDFSINRENPSYTYSIFAEYLKTLDAFAKYDSLFAVIAGNEVITTVNNSASAPYVKALIRDLKAYVSQKHPGLPIGYASSDDAATRDGVAKYFTCGDPSDNPDFIGLNLYEWCGFSSYKLSGFANRTREIESLVGGRVPFLVTEYGCNTIRPRMFQEVSALYSSEMLKVWSGAVLFEYSQEENDYGIVRIEDGVATRLQPEFDNFKRALKNVSTDRGSSAPPPPQSQAPAQQLRCPSIDPTTWLGSETLPPPVSTCHCDKVLASLTCVANNVPANDVPAQISLACGLLRDPQRSCLAIGDGDGRTGSYGLLSSCNLTVRLSWVYDRYHHEQGETDASCDFSGHAKIIAADETHTIQCPDDSLWNWSDPSNAGGGSNGTDGSGNASTGSSGGEASTSGFADGSRASWDARVSVCLLVVLVAVVAQLLLL